MNTSRVIKELTRLYPSKAIIENKNARDITTEIICELSSAQENPEESVAIAIIDRSTIHYHKIITENYFVIKGSLKIFKYDEQNKKYEEHELHAGESISIKPGEIHSNVGNATWVKVTSNPSWFIEDYYNLEKILKKYL